MHDTLTAGRSRGNAQRPVLQRRRPLNRPPAFHTQIRSLMARNWAKGWARGLLARGLGKGMGVTPALGLGLHASSVQRAANGGWKYDGPCPDAGVGWSRLQKYRICSRQGPRVDFEYVAPDGKRFRSLVAAQKHSSQLSQDCAVACAACASEECTPGNDIVICDGACGLAFHQ